LAEIRPDLPAALCAIIQKMMAKKPEERYQTAREIVRDVNQLREALNLGTVAAISISSSFIGSSTDGLRGVTAQVWPEAPSRKPWLLPAALIASLLLALAGGFGVGYWQYLQQPVKDQPDGAANPPKEGGGEKKPALSSEDEKALLALVYKYLDSKLPG